jgi:NAD(P)-dependent dehydrogenase (short-subunit alcohol dehydrogenase family)
VGTSNVADKVVVITGASSGIGESIAKLLARHGAKVVIGARRKNRIDAVVKEISAAGRKAVGFAVDVTKRPEVEALIKGAIDSFGRVDVLVNNAGIMQIAPIQLLKVDEWERQIDLNIKGGSIRGCRRPASNAEAEEEERPHHQHHFRFRDQSFRARRNGLLRHEGRRAHADRRTPDGTTLGKHPLHDDLAWRSRIGTAERNL